LRVVRDERDGDVADEHRVRAGRPGRAHGVAVLLGLSR
jgi:hypothetical protein